MCTRMCVVCVFVVFLSVCPYKGMQISSFFLNPRGKKTFIFGPRVHYLCKQSLSLYTCTEPHECGVYVIVHAYIMMVQ